MPVTFTVSPVAACSVGNPATGQTYTDTELLASISSRRSSKCQEMLQSSISDDERARLSPKANGFVQGVLSAWAGHHRLCIRPDDVWTAILCQLSFYINAHSEELREYFVAHEGQKKLEVCAVGTRYTVDFGSLARQMTRKVHENVVDSTLVEWILPNFSTTTLKDTTVCSVVMMATLKHYFSYGFRILCGIPSVTLEGTKADWQSILRRIERLYELGDEPSAWANMLRPILRRFVRAFDGEPDVEFWKHVIHRQRQMCGQDDMSGWLTAFCVWSPQGKWNGGPLTPLLAIPRPTMDVYGGTVPIGTPCTENNRQEAALGPLGRSVVRTFDTLKGLCLKRGAYRFLYTLNDVPYPIIDLVNLSAGYCEVNVEVDDNGKKFDCMMVAGHVATISSASDPSSPQVHDTLSPSAQWFMFIPEKESVSSGPRGF
ncbi:hypothetical protein C8Q77DRAFT_190237 [Trametes polyzona]|nr:hypothetical protein C8Q77DRAFT_190237 [Trametes polyzona]